MSQERTFDPDKPTDADNKPDTQKPDVEGPGARPGEATGLPKEPAPREALGGNDDAADLGRTGDTQGKPASERS